MSETLEQMRENIYREADKMKKKVGRIPQALDLSPRR